MLTRSLNSVGGGVSLMGEVGCNAMGEGVFYEMTVSLSLTVLMVALGGLLVGGEDGFCEVVDSVIRCN